MNHDHLISSYYSSFQLEPLFHFHRKSRCHAFYHADRFGNTFEAGPGHRQSPARSFLANGKGETKVEGNGGRETTAIGKPAGIEFFF